MKAFLSLAMSRDMNSPSSMTNIESPQKYNFMFLPSRYHRMLSRQIMSFRLWLTITSPSRAHFSHLMAIQTMPDVDTVPMVWLISSFKVLVIYSTPDVYTHTPCTSTTPTSPGQSRAPSKLFLVVSFGGAYEVLHQYLIAP